MNKDQVKGIVKEAAGKVQEKTGALIGNDNLRAKGLVNEMEGKTEKKIGDVKQAVKDATPKR